MQGINIKQTQQCNYQRSIITDDAKYGIEFPRCIGIAKDVMLKAKENIKKQNTFIANKVESDQLLCNINPSIGQ